MQRKIIELFRKFKAPCAFRPRWFDILFNPYFIARYYLYKKVKKFSSQYNDNSSDYGQRKKILDVGCGTKPYSVLFQKHDYIGIDIKGDSHINTPATVDKFFDGKNIPFDNNEFDLVIFTQVFEHVEYPEKLIKEIHRVLKNEGVLFLTMPFVWNEHEIPHDFRRFTTFGHKQILKQNNFKCISIQPTTGVFGTCGQLISAFLIEGLTKFTTNYVIQKIFIMLFCFPVQLVFFLLDTIFAKRGITLDYIVIAKKYEI